MSEGQDSVEQNLSPDGSRYELLLAIGDLVARSESLREAFQQIAEPVLALTGGSLLNLSLHDSRQNCMLTRYWKKDRECGEFEAFPIDDAASGWTWKHQEALTIPDIEQERRFAGCVPTLLSHGVRSYTVIPMGDGANCFGTIGLGKSEVEKLNDDDVTFLSGVARMGAFALEKQKAMRAYEEQQSLVSIGREVSSNLELEKLLPSILSSLRAIARYDRTVLALLDEEGKKLTLYGDALEWENFSDHETVVPIEVSLSGKAIQTRSVAFFAGQDLSEVKEPLAKAMCELGIRSVCCVPLVAGNRVWGALNASASTENAFGPFEAQYLQQVGTLIGTALQNAHTYREIGRLKDRLVQEKRYLESELRMTSQFEEIVGKSPALRRVLEYAAIVADTDSTVLITGETGTGKECIARAIHEMSRRSDRTFIKVNCAAIPTGLLESELFGHEKGAFTGAVNQKVGRLELADKGTLLLDEIGDIPLELQPKLLRVLQDQEFERLGGTKTIKVDVRLIAATNRDLARAVAEKEFREDLFYRLHVFPLHLPPLRERRDDIPLLIQHFAEKSAARMRKRIEVIPDEVVRALMDWKWPGNIRELGNFIERSVILSSGARLEAPLGELRDLVPMRAVAGGNTSLRATEREHIVKILRQTRGVLSGGGGAAARLGLKRTTLQYKMQRLGISRTDYML